MKHAILLLILFSSCLRTGKAQCPESVRRTGEELFVKKEYQLALDAFLLCENPRSVNAELSTKIGICYYHLNQSDKAQSILLKTISSVSSPPLETYLYLAKAYHSMLSFKEAAKMYKTFLAKTTAANPARAAVKDDIQRCGTGLKISKGGSRVVVVNLGGNINSASDDFKPLLNSAKPACLYFSSNRAGNTGCIGRANCKSDVYEICLEDGDWTSPLALSSYFVNSREHDIAQGFSENGSSIFLFRGVNSERGNLLKITIEPNKVELPSFVKTPFRPYDGDRDPFFYDDNTLMFSSRRPGGFGGFDIYITRFSEGNWNTPQNLGPLINSGYDEVSPWLANDGKSLYFSSDHPLKSIGGFDILTATYLDKVGIWDEPRNMGIEINTASDEGHFILDSQGNRAFFTSSNKKGLGGKDLYLAILNQSPGPQITTKVSPAFLKGFDARRTKELSKSILPEEVSYVLRPVYYSLPGGLNSPDNARQIQLLASLLYHYPLAKVILAAHCDKPDNQEELTEKYLNQILSTLQDYEIPLDNLMLLNAGNSFPAVEPANASINRRIEFYIANREELEANISLGETTLSSPSGVFFRRMMTGLSYRVIMPLTSKAEAGKIRLNCQDCLEESYPFTGQSFLSSRFYLTFNAADEMKKNFVNQGFIRARVAAYMNGWQLSIDEAKALQVKYPDLVNFIGNQ